MRLLAVFWLLLAGVTPAGAETIPAVNALRSQYAALQNDLSHNAFGRPLHLYSEQVAGDLSGEIHAVLEHPFARLNAALDGAQNWCDILILHINTKQCRTAGASPASTLEVHIGTKHWQPLRSAQRIVFDFRVRADTADYLRVELHSEQGPLGTRNFRIVLEAVPIDAGRSFIHLSYAYNYGLAARLAMQGYLGTVGSGKVGFSVVGKTAGGKPIYVDGVRGVVERNTMRYYLAIDTYVATFDAAPGEQVDGRLRRWFAATEQYAHQLRELDEAEYLQMKRREIDRQRGRDPGPEETG
jgi:hypothetical protein